jgi:hypothetical protein
MEPVCNMWTLWIFNWLSFMQLFRHLKTHSITLELIYKSVVLILLIFEEDEI